MGKLLEHQALASLGQCRGYHWASGTGCHPRWYPFLLLALVALQWPLPVQGTPHVRSPHSGLSRQAWDSPVPDTLGCLQGPRGPECPQRSSPSPGLGGPTGKSVLLLVRPVPRPKPAGSSVALQAGHPLGLARVLGWEWAPDLEPGSCIFGVDAQQNPCRPLPGGPRVRGAGLSSAAGQCCPGLGRQTSGPRGAFLG